LDQDLPFEDKNRPDSLFQCAEDEEYYISKIGKTKEEASQLFYGTIDQSASEVWKRQRKCQFTASKCYNLYTPQAPLNDVLFWENKMLSVLDAKEFSNFNTIRGIEDEPYARARYQCVYGVEVNILGYFNPPEMPWLGCSADGVVSGEILFETKSPECGIVQTARTIVPIINYIELDKDGNWTLKKRHPYYGQVQLCMALLGLKLCHFVIYASYDDSIAVIKVSYDEVFARLLIAKLTDLYFTYYLPLLRRRNFAP